MVSFITKFSILTEKRQNLKAIYTGDCEACLVTEWVGWGGLGRMDEGKMDRSLACTSSRVRNLRGYSVAGEL